MELPQITCEFERMILVSDLFLAVRCTCKVPACPQPCAAPAVPCSWSWKWLSESKWNFFCSLPTFFFFLLLSNHIIFNVDQFIEGKIEQKKLRSLSCLEKNAHLSIHVERATIFNSSYWSLEQKWSSSPWMLRITSLKCQFFFQEWRRNRKWEAVGWVLYCRVHLEKGGKGIWYGDDLKGCLEVGICTDCKNGESRYFNSIDILCS